MTTDQWDPSNLPPGLPDAVESAIDNPADDFSDSERTILWFLDAEVNSVPGYIAQQTGLSTGTVKNALRNLDRLGAVEHPYQALYRLPRND